MYAGNWWKRIAMKTCGILLLVFLAGSGSIFAGDDVDTGSGQVFVPDPQGGGCDLVSIFYFNQGLCVVPLAFGEWTPGLSITGPGTEVDLFEIDSPIKEVIFQDVDATQVVVQAKPQENAEIHENESEAVVDGSYKLITKLEEVKHDDLTLTFRKDFKTNMGITSIWMGDITNLSTDDVESLASGGKSEVFVNDGNLNISQIVKKVFTNDNLMVNGIALIHAEMDRDGRIISQSTIVIRRCESSGELNSGIGSPQDELMVEIKTIRY